MMASSGNHYLLSKSTTYLDERSRSISGFNELRSISNPKLAVKTRFPRIHAVISHRHVFNHVPSYTDPAGSNRNITDDNEFYNHTIEKWIEGSVTEIVKNITQAPLLVQIYANGEVKTEKAVKSKIWPNEQITGKWSSPDGIILVEELGGNRDQEFQKEGGTKAFGVLIQGKIEGRDECKSACYLLKTTTSSSGNGGGLGLNCCHYCLMKVRNFTESASSQLKDCWLVK